MLTVKHNRIFIRKIRDFHVDKIRRHEWKNLVIAERYQFSSYAKNYSINKNIFHIGKSSVYIQNFSS